jgi:hypothetical protein
MIAKEMFPMMVANICGKIVFAMPSAQEDS